MPTFGVVERHKGLVTSPIVPHDTNVVKRPALGDLNDVRSPLTHGVRARRVGCALRGPTHSGEISRSAAAVVPALGITSAVLGTNLCSRAPLLNDGPDASPESR